jgi:hypothetical protein
MRHMTVALLALAAAGAQAGAPQPIVADARAQSSYLAAGWHEGHVGKSPAGCIMFYLKQKTSSNQDALALRVVRKLEQRKGGAWTDVALKPLLATEPKQCNDGGDNG